MIRFSLPFAFRLDRPAPRHPSLRQRGRWLKLGCENLILGPLLVLLPRGILGKRAVPSPVIRRHGAHGRGLPLLVGDEGGLIWLLDVRRLEGWIWLRGVCWEVGTRREATIWLERNLLIHAELAESETVILLIVKVSPIRYSCYQLGGGYTHLSSDRIQTSRG